VLVVLLGAPLAWARPPDRIDRLIALLETNRSHKIRMQVAAHLSRLKEERVTQALRRALSDEDAGVRRVAAASLQERGVKAVPLPPTRRAAHAAQAREREKQRLQREREALARVYISMGTLANSSGAGGKPLARIFEAALRRELGTVRGVTLTWEGAPPTAEELARRKMAGFVLDGAITTL